MWRSPLPEERQTDDFTGGTDCRSPTRTRPAPQVLPRVSQKRQARCGRCEMADPGAGGNCPHPDAPRCRAAAAVVVWSPQLEGVRWNARYSTKVLRTAMLSNAGTAVPSPGLIRMRNCPTRPRAGGAGKLSTLIYERPRLCNWGDTAHACLFSWLRR